MSLAFPASTVGSGVSGLKRKVPPNLLTPSTDFVSSPVLPGEEMAMVEDVGTAEIAAVRRFTRFFTGWSGLLEESLLRSGYTLAEARVLYELAQRPAAQASALATELRMDPGYLSRILKGFEAAGLLRREPSPEDGRRQDLRLTTAGHAAFAPLDRGSEAEVGRQLARLSGSERSDLGAATATLERLLGEVRAEEGPDAVRLRDPEVGDLGWIVHRQAVLYGREYGFDSGYEGLISEIVGQFVRDFDPAGERCWVAERHGRVVGSVFAVRASDEVAKLRLLYVEPEARGLGIGRRLVEACIAFSRAAGYRFLTLWTNDILVAALRLYREAGFVLEASEPHHSFGRDMVGQTWTLTL